MRSGAAIFCGGGGALAGAPVPAKPSSWALRVHRRPRNGRSCRTGQGRVITSQLDLPPQPRRWGAIPFADRSALWTIKRLDPGDARLVLSIPPLASGIPLRHRAGTRPIGDGWPVSPMLSSMSDTPDPAVGDMVPAARLEAALRERDGNGATIMELEYLLGQRLQAAPNDWHPPLNP